MKNCVYNFGRGRFRGRAIARYSYYQPKTVRNMDINCGFSPSYCTNNVLALQSTNIYSGYHHGGMLRFRGFIVLVNIHKIDRRYYKNLNFTWSYTIFLI